MRGVDIRKLREGLALDPFAFAKILGVHVSTVYRWEQSETVTMDPLQREILEGLAKKLRAKRPAEKAAVGKIVLASFLVGGALVGLAALLNYITSSDESDKNKGEP